MGKTVGKIFLFFISSYVTIASAGIRLDVKNVDGIATDFVVVGQPFIIEATIDGVQGSVQAPTIAGLDQWVWKRTGMYMSTINGVSTTKYSYQVTINQPGSYTIGPARLVHQQQELLSDVVTVTAGYDESSHVHTKSHKKSQADLKAFLRFSVDVDRVVVGQKIKATLRFYYQDPALSLTHIGQPDISGFDIKEAKQRGGTVDVNGGHYRYAEWEWDMFPTQSGEFVVPAYSADYELPIQDSRPFGGLFMFVSTRAERKRVYSNAVKITVNSLPHANVTVNAIGSFESIAASITPPVAKKGEGMVLALEIAGDGNMEAIQSPVLRMPPELKYYDSNTTVIEATSADQLSKKRFEFIVQGVKSGDWEIPEQSFVCFDIAKNTYVTLRTSPLSVSIQSSANQEVANQIVTYSDSEQKSNDAQRIAELAPLNTKGPWYPVSERSSLPWIIFHLLLVAPLMYRGYPIMRNHTERLVYSALGGLKKRAYRAARKKIKHCAIDGRSESLYAIFVELFALLTHQPSPAISRAAIEEYVMLIGFSEQERKEWNMFFDQIAHAAYTQQNNKNVYELCRMATQWINRLESGV